MNDGDLQPLADEQKSLEDDRDKGTAGAGGAAASQGESRYCNGINEYDDEEFSETNEGLIKDRKEEIKNRKKYPNAEEKAILEHLGLNPEDDEALDYLAKRELWAEQELARMKAMPKPNVLTSPKGFDGNDKAYMDWMKAAYDGMRETKQILEDSDLDTTKPHVAIQSTTETDNKVEKHLEEKIANAENDEDREYYEKELKLFKKYRKYHDTYVIGQDEKGRTHIVHVSNKKGSDLKDPHNNTTPAQRFRIIAKTFGTEVAQEITDAIEWGIEKVTTVREQTLNRSRQVEIDENFSKVAEKAAGSYINKLNSMANKRLTKADGNPRPGNEFGVWLDRKGISPEEWAKMSTEQRLKEMQTFMVDEEYHNSLPKQKVRGSDPPEYVNYTPPYKPFSKIFIKVGEKSQEPKFWRDNPELNEDGVGLKDSIAIKQNEKEAVKEAHDHVVNTITNKDKELGFPKRDADGLVSENGPNTQAYITTVMDAMHFSAYIDMADEDDNKMILQMGIKGAKASHVRECLAEKSGYGDIPPGTREGLKEHIKRTSSVDAETGAIIIKGKDGETTLAEDTWRTAGDSQKVASGFGGDMRDCISEKVKK